jgi:GNAT superfamily N-acetyltransferase
MTGLDPMSIARERGLGLEAHRVLRCLEQDLSFDRYEPIDAGAIARALGIRPQAVSRALRILTEHGIIARGNSFGRAGTFRFCPSIAALPMNTVDAVLRSARDADIEWLARAGGFTASYGREELRKDIAAGRCWVLVADGVIIGQLAIGKDPTSEMSYHVTRLAIDRRFRRLGFGRRLLAAMERSFDGNLIQVHCAVSDPEYIRFLLNAGFALSGYVRGRQDGEARLFFGKIAAAVASPIVSRLAQTG